MATALPDLIPGFMMVIVVLLAVLLFKAALRWVELASKR